MICGHTSQRDGLPAIKQQAICVDTCAYGGGWLTCMEVHAGSFTQANQDGKLRRFNLAD